MDSYFKKNIRQDLQDILDFLLFRFPDETGKKHPPAATTLDEAK